MASAVVSLPSAVIANGGTTSSEVGTLDDCETLSIFAPSTLTGTCTLQVAPVDESGTTFFVQQSGASDVTLPAGKVTTLALPSFKRLRIVSNAAEGAERTFLITKKITPS